MTGYPYSNNPISAQQDSEEPDLSKLCMHTRTTRPWNLEQCVKHFSSAGIRALSVWRDLLGDLSPEKARRMIEAEGLHVVSLVRGGFFASADGNARQAALEDNLKALEEAEEVGAPLVVLVCGADPVQTPRISREQIRDGIERILPAAEKAGIRLAIEPLHPMYAADRSAIVTLGQAIDLAEEAGSDHLGVAVDVFHTWWDPGLHFEIERCGSLGKLFAFHVCDWKPDMHDMLNDRGLMGEGCIPVREIRLWMEQAGFDGYREVEIFSDTYWAMDQTEYLELIKDAYRKHT